MTWQVRKHVEEVARHGWHVLRPDSHPILRPALVMGLERHVVKHDRHVLKHDLLALKQDSEAMRACSGVVKHARKMTNV
jgi:hypothetical protein